MSVETSVDQWTLTQCELWGELGGGGREGAFQQSKAKIRVGLCTEEKMPRDRRDAGYHVFNSTVLKFSQVPHTLLRHPRRYHWVSPELTDNIFFCPNNKKIGNFQQVWHSWIKIFLFPIMWENKMKADKNMAFSKQIKRKNDYNYLCTSIAYLIKTSLYHYLPKHNFLWYILHVT